MKRIAKIKLQLSKEYLNDNGLNNNICIFSKCLLKRIEGYYFCYQHINADSPHKKYKMCSYKSEKDELIKCRQPVINENTLNLCTHHLALAISDHNDDKYKLIKNEANTSLLEQSSDEDEDNAEKFENETDSDFGVDITPEDIEFEKSLKHAGIYTDEEILRMHKIKLQKLNNLYKKQLEIVDERMKFNRKVYLMMKNNEQEKFGSNYTIYIKNQAQRDLLKAAESYKRNSGLDYIKENLKKRYNSNEKELLRKCLFKENEIKCEETCLPLSKYCKNHILHDTHQILFKPCSYIKCQNPIVPSISSNCINHISKEIISRIKNNEGSIDGDDNSQDLKNFNEDESKYSTTSQSTNDESELEELSSESEGSDIKRFKTIHGEEPFRLDS